MRTKSKLSLVAAITMAMLGTPAFAQWQQHDYYSMLQTDSPAANGGGSLGYNHAQHNVNH